MAVGIKISNKLRVIRNQVVVPGHEPLSEQTTSNLSIAMQNAASYIDLNKALQLIPGSKVIISYAAGPTSGSFGQDKFFIIPDGPPPNGGECPSNNILDSYKILRDASRVGNNFISNRFDIDCGSVDYGLIDNFNKGLCDG